MKKTLLVIAAVLIVICSGAYLYVRFHVLKAKDFKPDSSKAASPTDLRPAIIAKLQQLVKDGSDGLYILSIRQITPNLAASTVDIDSASLDIDSSALKRLDNMKKLPDDVFRIKLGAVHLAGFGIADLLDKKNMNIESIVISEPRIDSYHRSRPYNSEEKKTDSSTLFQRLQKVITTLKIGKINIEHGHFKNHDLDNSDNVNDLNNIVIHMSDILVDSATQYDKKRFLFAKHTAIHLENYKVLTPEKKYVFQVGRMDISGEEHSMVAENVSFQPVGGIRQYEKNITHRETIYDIKVPRIILKDVHWWAMINRNKFKVGEADLLNPVFIPFSDYSLPAPEKTKVDNYPHQLLMGFSSPVSIDKLTMHHMKIIYQEYEPALGKTASAPIDDINATITHISNIKNEIKQHPEAIMSASGYLMNRVLTKGDINFNLAEYKAGNFTADFSMDTVNNSTINPIAEPMARFTVKRGQMQHGTVHIEGNNFNAKAKISVLYNDLHVTPLKSDSNGKGELKRKRLKSFIANKFFVKDNNPTRGNLREPDVALTRDPHGSFFSMIWESIMIGMLKTAGVPAKLFYKNAQ